MRSQTRSVLVALTLCAACKQPPAPVADGPRALDAGGVTEKRNANAAEQKVATLNGLNLPGKPQFVVVREKPYLALKASTSGSEHAHALWSALHRARAVHGLTAVVMPDAFAEQAAQEPERIQQMKSDERFRVSTLDAFEKRREADALEQATDMLRHILKRKGGTFASLQRQCTAKKLEWCPSAEHPWSDQRRKLEQATISREVKDVDSRFNFAGRDAFNESLARQFGQPIRRDPMSVWLFALPASQIPVELGFGHFNECPHPLEHQTVLQEWEKQWGAELAFIDHDTLELYVERPPASDAELKRVAWEQYVYCADIVDQGTETVANLAENLAGNHAWFFWWD